MSHANLCRRPHRCIGSARSWFYRAGHRTRTLRRLLVEHLEDRRLLSVYEFDHVLKDLVLGLPDGSTERVLLSGTASMLVNIGAEGEAQDTDNNGLDQVTTELLTLNLAGTSSLGPVQVRLDPEQPSEGQIEEVDDAVTGILDVPPYGAYPADSFFDVWFEIDVGGLELHTAAAERLTATLNRLPCAVGDAYFLMTTQPIDLLAANNQPTGFSIVSAQITLDAGEQIHVFPDVRKELVWKFSNGVTERVKLAGTATVVVGTDAYGRAVDTDGDGREQVPTEWQSLDLYGRSAAGPVHVRLNPLWASVGELEELANDTPGVLDLPPFTAAGTADSFFDVFVEIEVGEQVYQSATAERLQAVITQTPPAPGETYATPEDMRPIELLDWNQQHTGIFIISQWLTPNPEPLVERFPFVQKELTLKLPSGGTENVFLTGTAVVRIATDQSGWAADTDGDGLDQVPTELIAMNLTGTSSLGPVVVTTDPSQRSFGEIEEGTDLMPGRLDLAPFAPGGDNNCDSFFDIWVEISIDGQILHTKMAEHLSASITQLPPAPGETYTTPLYMTPIPLVDSSGQSTGFLIVSQWLVPNPEREIDHFPFARKELVLQLADGARERILLQGTATFEVGIDTRGRAADTDGDGRDQVATEMTELNLTGTCSLGPVTVGLDPRRPSVGEIEELVNNTPGTLDLPPFTTTGSAFSFFDVYLQVEIGGRVLVTREAERLRAIITYKPAGLGEVYATPSDMYPIALVDPNAWYYDRQDGGMQYPELWIVSERLIPIPTGRIRVVKDAQPNDPQDFTFDSPELGTFVLDDDSDPTWPNSRIFSNLAPGDYTVKEPPVPGWHLASIVIADPDGGSSVDLIARTATLDLDPGENITVTFTNRQNQPPVADAGGPYLVDEGGSVQLSALDSDDDVGISRYEWDFDSDGVYDDSYESQPVFSAAALDGPQNLVVRLRVEDDEGAISETTALVHVRNVAPRVSDLAPTSPIDEGGTAILSGTVSDPLADASATTPGDTLTLEVDWGDGSTQSLQLVEPLPDGVTYAPATGVFTLALPHVYADDGPSPGNGTPADLYVVTGRVVDDDGGWAPLVQPIGPRIANEDNDSGWTVTQQIMAGEPIGQTFTAISNNRLDTISFYVADMNASVAPTDYSIEFALYEGVGTTGRLLGRRDYSGLSAGFEGFVAVDFSAVTLLDGQLYTAVLTNDTARWGRVACGNQYAGGTAIYAGVPSPTSDALFIVQWQPDRPAPRLANEDNDTGWTVTQQIQAGEPIGQTFTAISDNRLDTISFYVADMNAPVAPTDDTITFELYEGVGTSGRRLGTREYTGLSDDFSGFVAADFSAVTLVAGQVYTAVLTNDTTRWGRVACGNQYAGGTALYADAPSPTSDALFVVQWQPDGQPPQLANDDNDTGWTVTQQIQAGEPIGQTFTAISDNRLDTLSFYVADMNAEVAPTDYSVTFELYEGVGVSGRLLGRREYTGLSVGFSGFIEADFSAVTLVAGEVYTAVLSNDTARWGRVACGNQYAGGTALYAGAPSPTSDALFVIQWQPDGQPPQLANDDNDTGWTVTQQIMAGEPIGQTFTALSDNRLSTISFYVADMNAEVAPTDLSVTFELYEGLGTGGRLLGRREYTTLTPGFSGFIAVDFSAVTLVAGEVYTAVLSNDTARWGRVACGNQYAGGTALYADAPSPTSDALFRVTWQPDQWLPQLANDDNDTGWEVTQQILAGEPIGQTFTAISDHRLSTLSFYVADMNASVAPTDHSLTFALYEGVGTGGRRLGTREYTALWDGFAGFVMVDFSAVTLVDGGVYTAVVTNDTTRWGRVAIGNQYAGGTALYADAPSPTADALFRIGWQPAPALLVVEVRNVPPAFEAGLDEALPAGVGAFSRSIEFTDPGVLDVHTVTVDYGDGSGPQVIAVPLGDREFDLAHVYTVRGDYQVSVTVADDDGGVSHDDFWVSVHINLAPVADAGGPYFVAEGGSVQLSALDSDDDVGISRYEWDFDSDGYDDSEESQPVFSAAALDGPQNVVVRLRVTDDEGAISETTALVHVRNVAPRVSDLALTSPIDEGGTAILSGTITDPANDALMTRDALTLEVAWGDGVTENILLVPPLYDRATGEFAVEHVYADDGPSPGNGTPADLYVVTGRVVDDDGGWTPLVQPIGPRIANDANDTGWTVTQQIMAGEPIGQTFTAISDNRLDTISFYVADMNTEVAEDYSIEFALYEGVGTTGRLLGRRDYSGLSNGFEGFVAVDFSAVTLLDGQLYTAVLTNDTARWGRVACGNQYAGGTAIYAGVPSPTSDALFIVQWQPDRPAPRLANEDNDTGWTVTQQIQAGEPIGQTFTAISHNRLDTLSFYVADMNASAAPTDDTITFELYEGVGTSGRRLGTREYTGLSDNFSGFVAADFSAVTLVAGQVYTAVLTNDTARWGRVAGGNQYAGGTALYADAPSPTSDALFAVQWQADGQPPQLANDDNDTGWTVTQQIQAGEPIGQTFTAISDNRLDTLSFYVADMNADIAPDDYSVTFELYEGVGVIGRLLGRREYTGLSDDYAGFIEVDFSAVTLVAGEMYTAVLSNDTARWGRVACGNQYAGGTAIYAGAPSPTSDALFVIQWQPDGQPPQLANDDNDTGWTVTQQILAGEPIGQTFTAIADNRLSTISFYVADMNAEVAPTDLSVTFELYEGLGTGGRLLGRREYTTLTPGFSGFIAVDFSAVTLVAGDLYTAVLSNDTARWGRVACGNQYAGGTALYADAPSPTSDALFRVTWQPDGPMPQLANDDNDTGWEVTQQILAGEPIGQTFTAISDHRLSTLSFYVADMNASVAPTDHSLTFELYEGVGTGGRRLGTRQYTALWDGFAGFVMVDFSAVTLVDGGVYTAVVTNDTTRWGRVAIGNQYAGGTALYADAPSPTADALFRIGWQPAPALLVVEVRNVPPAFEAGPDAVLAPEDGGQFHRTTNFFRGDSDDIRITVSFGDGSPLETRDVPPGVDEFELTHTYADAGDYTVTVTMSDDDLGFMTDSFTVTALLWDWGDAPDGDLIAGYPTLAAHNGASHKIRGPWLGDAGDRPDAELDGQPDAQALGDDLAPPGAADDEDGVVFPPLVVGQTNYVSFAVHTDATMEAYVAGWIDFDGDQQWAAGEQFVAGMFGEGTHSVPVTVPTDAGPGTTFARVRISGSPGLGPVGPADSGEVEDHEVRLVTLPENAKWVQLPDLSPQGIAVAAPGVRMLADDFECRQTSLLTDVHLWGAWKGDDPGAIQSIAIRIHADDPAGPAGTDLQNVYSKPDPAVLWAMNFGPEDFTEHLYYTVPEPGEYWWDPQTGELVRGGDREVWQIDIAIDRAEAFLQRGAEEQPVIYWLDVRVTTEGGQFGWKTRQWPDHFLDDAVWTGTMPPWYWQELRYPEGHPYHGLERDSIDMAFALTFQEVAPQLDWGDAPEDTGAAGYPTTAANDGARHVIRGPWLGDAADVPDAESDGQPHAQALGDDLAPANTDDEDGVVIPPLVRGQTNYVTFEVSLPPGGTGQAYVDGWIDFNQDRQWDSSEQFVSGWYGAGVHTVAVTPPLTATAASTFARVRINSAGPLGPTGLARDGEVEDHEVQLVSLDWGDAPDSVLTAGYPTLAINNGARHVIRGPWLGDRSDGPDGELDGQPHPLAVGDDLHLILPDDEDGVTIPPLVRGQTNYVTLEVQTLNAAYVDGWIDFNADRAWTADEQFVSGWFGPGTHTVPVTAPLTSASSAAVTFARVRINSQGPLGPTGGAADGEVEDHAVRLVDLPPNTKWVQLPDLSRNGIDIQVDALRVAADDFECREPSLLTDVHLWGSWKGDAAGEIQNIRLSIHADDPAGDDGTEPDNTFSQPEPEVLWSADFGPDQFQLQQYYEVPLPGEYWWDPYSGDLLPGGDQMVWQVDIPIAPQEAFLQKGSAEQPVIYWLEVRATTENGNFGWKTRQWPDHFTDDAVWDYGSELPRNWDELRYPEGHPYYGLELDSIDLAFALTFEPVASRLDWGDAPDSATALGYPTLAIHNGARHVIQGPWLGDATDNPDAEGDGQPHGNALGDDLSPTTSDDEDGVVFPPLVVGQNNFVSFEVQTWPNRSAYVDGWIDYNGNKQWEAGEQFVSGWFGPGTHTVPVTPPANAVPGQTFARVRINSRGPLPPTGPAADGEVEDHAVRLAALPANMKWVQLPDLSPHGIDIQVDDWRVAADDFECRDTSLVTGVRLWGSWKDDIPGRIENIRLSIHGDDPVGQDGAQPDNTFSQPAPDVLWSLDVGPGQYSAKAYYTLPVLGEYWWDVLTNDLAANADRRVWQIDIPIDPSQAFLQTGTEQRPVIYWLEVRVQTEWGEFGWKTRQWPEQQLDDAVWDAGSELPRTWRELRYPDGHPYAPLENNSIDLAFALSTATLPDIRLQEAVATGETTLRVSYAIDHAAAAPFELGFFTSADPSLGPGDIPVGQVTLSDPADLTPGLHVKTYTIGTGPGAIALPGAGVAETDDEYYVLAVADPLDLIRETDADPIQEDNTTLLVGVYHPPGGAVFVHGTQEADQIAVSGRLQLLVNGNSLTYDLATTTGLRVRGHGGDDQASFDAGSGFPVTPPRALFVHGGAGNNALTLRGSTGDDVLQLYPARAQMSGPGYVLNSIATGQIYAYATAGGNDAAYLYDSSGDDTFTANGTANGVRLQGPACDNYAESFDRTYAYATAGGTDTARLYDSAGDDTFTAAGTANGVRLQGTGIDFYAEKFEKTYGYATAGGTDTARLYDSAGDDTVTANGTANGIRLQGTGIDLYAEQFEKTYAYATGGGTDTARLYDSAGDDTLTTDGSANGVRLQGPGIDLYAEDFEKTYAYATGGGSDTARMYDSAGDDTFAFDYPGGRFQGVGFDTYAEHFERYFAYASHGGYDRSLLYDSAGNDALVGRSNWYQLATPYGTARGEAFDYVKATKHEAGTDTLDVSAVDYLFEHVGEWA